MHSDQISTGTRCVWSGNSLGLDLKSLMWCRYIHIVRLNSLVAENGWLVAHWYNKQIPGSCKHEEGSGVIPWTLTTPRVKQLTLSRLCLRAGWMCWLCCVSIVSDWLTIFLLEYIYNPWVICNFHSVFYSIHMHAELLRKLMIMIPKKNSKLCYLLKAPWRLS